MSIDYRSLAMIGLNDLQAYRMQQEKKLVLKAVSIYKNYVDGEDKGHYETKSDIKDYKSFEDEIVDNLTSMGLLTTVNSLLSIDIDNEINDFELPVYQADKDSYSKGIEEIRATLLEDFNEEDAFLLWLLREMGLNIIIFSESEIIQLEEQVSRICSEDKVIGRVYNSTITDPFMKIGRFIYKTKYGLLSSDTWKGLKFMVPAIDRSNSVFVATDEIFANDKARLENVIAKMEKHNIEHEVLSEGTIPLVRVCNKYYELIPSARVLNNINVHGVIFKEYIG